MPSVRISPYRISLFLFVIAVYLSLQSMIINILYRNFDIALYVDNFIRLGDVNSAHNLIRSYSTLLLQMVAIVLAIILFFKYRQKGPYIIHWAMTIVLFVSLSLDKAIAFHKVFLTSVNILLERNVSRYTEGIIVTLLLIIVIALFLKFWLHLPPRTRKMLIVATLVYVLGALVLNYFSFNIWHRVDLPGWHEVEGNLEELIEMSGVILFIYTFLSYLQSIVPRIELYFDEPSEQAITQQK